MNRPSKETITTLGAVAALLILAKVMKGSYTDQYAGGNLPQRPTLSKQRMAMLADIVDQALLGDPLAEDEEAAAAAICEAQNDADVLGIIHAFGERSEPFINNPFGQDYTLPQAVVRYFDQDQLDALNACLASKGITFTF